MKWENRSSYLDYANKDTDNALPSQDITPVRVGTRWAPWASWMR